MEVSEVLKNTMLSAHRCGLNHAVAYRVGYSTLSDHLNTDPNLEDMDQFKNTLASRLAHNLNIDIERARELVR